MTTDQPKVIPIKIRIRLCRPAFFKLHTPTYRTDKFGQPIKINPKTGEQAKPRYQVTPLIDPSTKEGAEDIATIKAEATRLMNHRFGNQANWPKADERTGMGAPIWCFGAGNALKKVYGGFKDMWYIKCSDTERPLLGCLDGREVRLLSDGWHVCDKDHNPTEEKVDQAICPYAGCNATARISLWTYNNEACGVNANIISLQFKSKNAAFGGREEARAEEEFESYGEYTATANAAAPDPFA